MLPESPAPKHSLDAVLSQYIVIYGSLKAGGALKINVCSDGPGTLFVYNIIGEKVFEGFVFGLKEIDLGFLSKGVYVFSIKTKNKKTSKKIYKL